jgi:hypothetical protein
MQFSGAGLDVPRMCSVDLVNKRWESNDAHLIVMQAGAIVFQLFETDKLVGTR